jgi:hypothetical protein
MSSEGAQKWLPRQYLDDERNTDMSKNYISNLITKPEPMDTVTYIPIARQWLGKHILAQASA